MRKTFAALVSVAVLGSTAAVAAPYGSAGCGLGSVLLGDKPGFMQVFAATTNGIFATQIFGITTGTSNCGEAASPDSVKTTQLFIEVNREAVAKDMSRGSGETIVSLANIMGCQESAVVGATLQANFSTIMPNASVSSEQVAQNVLNTVKANKLSCTHVN